LSDHFDGFVHESSFGNTIGAWSNREEPCGGLGVQQQRIFLLPFVPTGLIPARGICNIQHGIFELICLESQTANFGVNALKRTLKH
jgi:hypothetical protein